MEQDAHKTHHTKSTWAGKAQHKHGTACHEGEKLHELNYSFAAAEGSDTQTLDWQSSFCIAPTNAEACPCLFLAYNTYHS